MAATKKSATTRVTATNAAPELESQVKNLKSRVSELNDELKVLRHEVEQFKTRVSKDVGFLLEGFDYINRNSPPITRYTK